MEPKAFYQPDNNNDIHQGAIYQYRPFFWLEPPLWLLREVTFPRSGQSGSAKVWGETERPDAFRRGDRKNEEYVLATAKKRFLIILSRDSYLKRGRNDNILVAPIFSFKDVHYENHPSFVDRVKKGRLPGIIYVPEYSDGAETVLKEGMTDLRQAKTIKREFLTTGKLDICLTESALSSLVYEFLKLLPTDLL